MAKKILPCAMCGKLPRYRILEGSKKRRYFCDCECKRELRRKSWNWKQLGLKAKKLEDDLEYAEAVLGKELGRLGKIRDIVSNHSPANKLTGK